MPDFPLGRREPTDWSHVEKYSLTTATEPTVPTSAAIGVNWYSNFDDPVLKDGNYWIGLTNNLGFVRGGHCLALKPRAVTDPLRWWDYYNQGVEGSCVGFGCSRMMSLQNRKKYDARWLYHLAQQVDEWDDTPPEEGTSVNAGMKILKAYGHRAVVGEVVQPTSLVEGISAYRWATDASDLQRVTGFADKGYVVLLNSWGRGYPHKVRMPIEVLERLRLEGGELAVITDR